MKKLFACCLLAGFLMGCGASSSEVVNDTRQESVSEEVTVQWVDVRTAAEFNSGHIPGAINLPYDGIQENHPLLQSGAIMKDATLYLYCRSGRRSRIAKSRLEELGYQVKDIGSFSAAKKVAETLTE